MTDYSSDFLKTLDERGFIHQVTDAEEMDKAYSAGQPVAAYIGFDATASSLHVGSLVQIMMLRWLQKTGHKPIVLMGGGTTKIGDPSGKDEARKMLTDEDIAANIEGIKQVFGKFLTFGDGPTDAVMVNNDDWLSGLQYINFLRDYGRHFSVNRMLGFESVKLRLDREQPLSFLEFNYMILQGYDFLELNRRYKCRLQMGGSDQWGNIINGVELGRRVDQAGLFGLTTPLITTASGAKMGKTAGGAVWLNEDLKSPYEYWQFWRNTEDSDVGRFLRLFTELPLDEVARLEAMEGPDINEAKKILANEATKMCHGEAAAIAAAETARKTFEEGQLTTSLPSFDLPKAELEDGIGLLALFTKAGLTGSNGEARKMMMNGGIRLNDEKMDDAKRVVTTADLTGEQVIKLSAGKKKHLLIKPV